MTVDRNAARGIMRTQNGWVDLLNPQPSQVRLDDIIYALQRLNRFTGHSDITVLEHSCRAYLFACDMGIEDPRQLLTVLMHDAHEAYVGDISRSLKQAMRGVHFMQGMYTSDFDHIEHRMAQCVAKTFGLDDISADYVKEADNRALAAEVEIIWGPTEVIDWGLERQERLIQFAPEPSVSHAFRTYFNGLVTRIADEQLRI